MFDSIKGEAVLRRVAAFQRSERASVKAHVKLLQSLSITSPLIFDIGAHAGLVSKQYIRFCKRKKLLPKIVAFEPQQSQLPLLQKNLGHHGEIRNLAVGGSGGGTNFLNCWNDSTVASFLMVEPSLADRSNNFAEGSTVRVHTTTLDAEVERLGRHPSLIKIDVQGYEREVLAGATKTLSSGYVPVIGTELIFSGLYSNQTTPEEIMATMKNYGYKLWSIDRLVRAQPGYLYFGDATFVSPEVWRIAGGI